jgi:hypothetical protein
VDSEKQYNLIEVNFSVSLFSQIFCFVALPFIVLIILANTSLYSYYQNGKYSSSLFFALTTFGWGLIYFIVKKITHKPILARVSKEHLTFTRPKVKGEQPLITIPLTDIKKYETRSYNVSKFALFISRVQINLTDEKKLKFFFRQSVIGSKNDFDAFQSAIYKRLDKCRQ